MDAVMMLAQAFSQGGTLTTDGPYLANFTWVAPVGVNTVQTVVGYGAPGAPGEPYSIEFYTQQDGLRRFRKDGGVEDTYGAVSGLILGTTPEDYIGPFEPLDGSTVYSGQVHFTLYVQHMVEGTTAPTTGASATAFGNTFEGGTGGDAFPEALSNIAVTPGNSYNFVIPSGASITLNYIR